MWKWFKDQARAAFKWVTNREVRTLASLLAIVVTAYICIAIGGVMGQAVIITLCVYVGVLITLNRMRRPPPKDSGVLWGIICSPIVHISNFFFKHSLITTIAIGALAASAVGFSTVTGVAVGAICAFAGDIIVSAFISTADWIREIQEEEEPTTEASHGEAKLDAQLA